MSPLIDIRDLKVQFLVGDGAVQAVKGVSFAIPAGRTLALVGESGSGKTVISQTLMRILPQNAEITGGQVLFNDPAKPDEAPVDLVALPADGKQIRQIRGGSISIIFQEPMTSLSPLHTVGDQVSEALLLHLHERGFSCTSTGRARETSTAADFDAAPFELSCDPFAGTARGDRVSVMVRLASVDKQLGSNSNEQFVRTFLFNAERTEMAPRARPLFVLKRCKITTSVSEEGIKTEDVVWIPFPVEQTLMSEFGDGWETPAATIGDEWVDAYKGTGGALGLGAVLPITDPVVNAVLEIKPCMVGSDYVKLGGSCQTVQLEGSVVHTWTRTNGDSWQSSELIT